jgi:hypothetical protein
MRQTRDVVVVYFSPWAAGFALARNSCSTSMPRLLLGLSHMNLVGVTVTDFAYPGRVYFVPDETLLP